MPGKPARLRRDATDLSYYFDASIQIDVSRAFGLLRDGIVFPGEPGVPKRDAKDIAWLAEAGKHKWVVIMRDKKIRNRPAELAQLKRSGVRAFCLTASGNMTKWDTASLLMRAWEHISETASTKSGPYIYAVRKNARLDRIAS